MSLDGERDILGLWAGTGGEGAKFWMAVLTNIRNRGTRDVFFVVCDGLKGLPEVVGNVWPLATVQTCIIHLIRNTFRLASRRDWDALKRAVKPIYTAVNATAARQALDELATEWASGGIRQFVRSCAVICTWAGPVRPLRRWVIASHRPAPLLPHKKCDGEHCRESRRRSDPGTRC